METVLYADVLFFVNFGMDIISIWLTFLIVHQKTSALRLVLSSVLGGCYGVLSVIIASSGLLSFSLSIIVSFLMILISACGKQRIIDYVKYTFILWGVGALSGGIITAVCALGGNRYDIKTHNSSFFILAAGMILSVFIVRQLSNNRISHGCTVRLKEFGSVFEFSALVDSGDLVVEPISSMPVIFVSRSVFGSNGNRDIELLAEREHDISDLSNSIKRKVRMVYVNGICEERIITAVIPDEIYIINRKRIKRVRAVFTIDCIKDYNGFEGIVPASLLR